jgi:hypothetical protein
MKTLTKVGSSLALVIDQPIFELLDLDDQTPLEVTTDGHRSTISPATTADTAGSPGLSRRSYPIPTPRGAPRPRALPALSRRLRCDAMPAGTDPRHPAGAARCRRARSPG